MTKNYSGLKIALFPSYGHALPHIIECFKRALTQLGVQTYDVPKTIIEGKTCFTHQDLDKLVALRPDFCFFIGQNGYVDQEGVDPSDHYLHRHQLSYVNFMFDFPMRPHVLGCRNHEYLKGTFIWDRKFIPVLKKLGLKNIHHLPLATDPEYFRPAQKTASMLEISFIGSIIDEKTLRQHRDALPAELLAMAETLIRQKITNNSANIYDENIIYDERTQQNLMDLLGYLNARHTTFYRKNMIYHLSKYYPLVVFGNKEWQSSDYHKLMIKPMVDYPDILSIYQNTLININLSATHLASAINQRTFDGFGAGAFVLNDYKDDLIELFPKDDLKLPYFTNKFDLVEQVQYYLIHPDERESITRHAQEIILAKHTWVHRMGEVLDKIL